MATINMPRLSDTMQEGTIGKWLKKQGDQVKRGDILAEVETDKATMELESYDEGVLEQILVGEGETAPIGQPVAIVGTGAGGGAAPARAEGKAAQGQPAQAQSGAKEKAPASARAQSARSAATRDERDGAAPAAAGEPPAPSDEAAAPSTEAGEAAGAGGVKASPLARHMAAEHGLDLGQITGTGPGGRIVRDDIEDYLEQRQRGAPAAAAARGAEEGAPPAEAPAATAPGDEVVKLSRMQAAIARRLAEAKQTIPHFYVSTEVDMTEALALRQTLNAAAGEDVGASGGRPDKVTVNDLIIKAAALALRRFPEVNSSLRGTEFVRHAQINVGFAVDVPDGLVVPVVRDADVKGVRAIARETKALGEKARGGKLSQRDLEGGTFSVSNLGMMDVTDFVPIINPPEAAILAVASTRQRFVPVDGRPVVRDIMPLTMSADHRIIYGAQVARFLQEVKRLLQSPYTLLG